MDPTFLDVETVLDLHRDQIERYGGTPGLRDEGMMKSALAMPSAGMAGQYFHPTLHEMAAAYLFHLVQNHPFVDGNKRVAAVAAFTFLWLNDVELTATEPAFERIVRRTASGETTKFELADFFQSHSKKRRKQRRDREKPGQ